MAHARDVRAISQARVKTDKIDARVLADLLAADLSPKVWIGDDRVRAMRRVVSRRRGLVKRRTQIKNEIAAVLHRNIKPRPPVSDLFGKKGRVWLADQELPGDERLTVDAAHPPPPALARGRVLCSGELLQPVAPLDLLALEVRLLVGRLLLLRAELPAVIAPGRTRRLRA